MFKQQPKIKRWMIYTTLNLLISCSFIGFFVHAAATKTDKIPVIFCDTEAERSTNWKNGSLVVSKDTRSIAYLADNQYWKLNSDQYSSGTYTPTLTNVANIASSSSAICAYIKNDRAEMIWVSNDLTNQPMYFNFTYRVLS